MILIRLIGFIPSSRGTSPVPISTSSNSMLSGKVDRTANRRTSCDDNHRLFIFLKSDCDRLDIDMQRLLTNVDYLLSHILQYLIHILKVSLNTSADKATRFHTSDRSPGCPCESSVVVITGRCQRLNPSSSLGFRTIIQSLHSYYQHL